MRPVPLTSQQLAATLRDMADHVEAEDSWEGNITYAMPEADDPPAVYAMVRAAYRIGNSQGQGGMRVVGAWDE